MGRQVISLAVNAMEEILGVSSIRLVGKIQGKEIGFQVDS